MSLTLAILSTVSAAVGPTPVPLANRLEHRSGPLLLGEVADLAPLPQGLRERAGKMQIGTIRSARTAVTISHRQIVAHARAMLPALGPWLLARADGLLIINGQHAARGWPVVTGGSGSAIVARDSVVATVSTGIFQISREGVAMQNAKAGQRLFVRTPDGVITALCCGSK